MAMWNRFKRMVRSQAERLKSDPDPLKRGVGGSLGKLDENLVTLKAHLKVLEKQIARLRRREAELDALVKASQAHSATTKALGHQTDLLEVKRQLALKESDLEQTRAALERAMAVKAAYREVTDGVPPASAGETATSPPAPGTPKVASADEVAAWEAANANAGSAAAAPAPTPAGPIEIHVAERGSRKTIGDGDGSGPVPAPSLEESREIPPKTLGQSVPSATESGSGDLLEELEKLGKLRESGALTEEEFSKAKRKLLGT